MNIDSKKCPYCAEQIKRDAILCRFCGSNLSSDLIAGIEPRDTGPVFSPTPIFLTLASLFIILVLFSSTNPSRTDFINKAQDNIATNMFQKNWRDLNILERGIISLTLNNTVRRDDYVFFSVYTFDPGLLSIIQTDAKQMKFIGVLGSFHSTDFLSAFSFSDASQALDNAILEFNRDLSELGGKIERLIEFGSEK